jgi:hypothetical protein
MVAFFFQTPWPHSSRPLEPAFPSPRRAQFLGGPPSTTPGVVAPTTAAATVAPPLQPPPAVSAPAASGTGGALFARVYGRAAPKVAARLHAADPVLAEWIR